MSVLFQALLGRGFIPCLDRWNNTIRAKPITHHETIPTPFLTKNILNQKVMSRAERPIDLVISSHNRPRVTITNSNLERLQRNFAQSSVRNLLIDEEASRFLVICGKMLNTSANTCILETIDELTGDFAGQVGIFAVGFEVAAAEWCSGNTYYKR